MSYTDEELLNDLTYFYMENNRVPKIRELCKSKGYPSYLTYINRFGSLRDACVSANIPIDDLIIRPKEYSLVQLISILIEWFNDNGKWPRYSDFNKTGKTKELPHTSTYENKFGSFRKAIDIAKQVDGDNINGGKLHSLLEGDVDDNKDRVIKLTHQEINHILLSLDDVICCDVCKKIASKLRK